MNKRGFTLIELLVVIAIIGVLSSVVLASLNTARTKGNDSARIQNVKALKTAMELYYNDNNTYPQYGSADTVAAISNLSSYLVPTHISKDPAKSYNGWRPVCLGHRLVRLVYIHSGGRVVQDRRGCEYGMVGQSGHL